MNDVPAHRWPQIRIVIELTRVLTRAGYAAPHAGPAEDLQLMEWAAEFGATGGTSPRLAENRIPAYLKERRDYAAVLETFALRKAHCAGWVSHDLQLAPQARRSMDRAEIMLKESLRVDAVSMAVNDGMTHKSFERHCMEKQVMNDLRIQLLQSLLRTSNLYSSGATLDRKGAGGKFASVMYRDVQVALILVEEVADQSAILESTISALEEMITDSSRLSMRVLDSVNERRKQAESIDSVDRFHDPNLHVDSQEDPRSPNRSAYRVSQPI